MQDRGVWLVSVHGVAKSQTWPRDWTTALGYSYDLYSQKFHIVKWTGKRKTFELIMTAAEWVDYGGSYSLHICALLVSSSINMCYKEHSKCKNGFMQSFMA